jgi:hypothetical protein
VLLQPCHLQLVIQAVALLSRSSRGVIITLLTLPPLLGTLIALVIPTLNGLTYLEIVNFWVQHILEGLVPLYLLCRNNFCASKLCTSSFLHSYISSLVCLVHPTHSFPSPHPTYLVRYFFSFGHWPVGIHFTALDHVRSD